MVKEQALLWKKKLTSPKLTVYLFNEVNKSYFLLMQNLKTVKHLCRAVVIDVVTR